MPRIHQNAEKYAVADFQQEIRKQQGAHNVMSVRSLATLAGIPHTTLSPKLKEPDKLLVSDIRKLVRAIQPDIGILLALMGYSKQDIKKYKEDKSNV